MARASRRKCGCGGELGEIRLIDRSNDSNYHYTLSYAAANAKRSFWLGHFPIEGALKGYLCGACGRVTLYAEPGPVSDR